MFFVTAIGHKEDISLLQKVADKAFITPTALGQHLRELYNNTIEELQNSKAHLVKQVTVQLETNYKKQIENLINAKTLEEKIVLLQQKINEQKQNKFLAVIVILVIGILLGMILMKSFR